MVIYNNNLENYSVYNKTPPVDHTPVNNDTIAEHIQIDHANWCIYFGVVSAFWLLCFILGMIYAVTYKLDFYIRLTIILINISFAILSLRNASLWNKCRKPKVQEGWNDRQCAEMRDRTNGKVSQINELITKYNDKLQEFNNKLTEANKKSDLLVSDTSNLLDQIVGKYSLKIQKDSDEFKNAISRENAWNSQYSNIQNYANQMTISLDQINKNTTPLQYDQTRSVYNSKQ
jgi:hypothetical protein